MEFKIQNIADFLNGRVEGDADVCVSDVSKIEDGKPGTLAFLANPKYEKYIYETKATAVLVNNDFQPEKNINATLIRVEDAYQAFASLLEMVDEFQKQKSGIEQPSFIAKSAKHGDGLYLGAFAYIGEGASLGESVKVYPQAYVGSNVKVGDNCIIYPGVKIYDNCVIGANCILHAGAVIGSDGFGFAPTEDGSYKKIPQLGNVILEDNVEVGANTTIDCSTMGSTVIGKGVKLDNLIQIAHNCVVGSDTVMAAQVGVAGSTKIGSNCQVGGHTGISGHITIEDNVKVGPMTGVSSRIKSGRTVLGVPAMDIDNALKTFVVYKRLPEMKDQIADLKKEIKEIQSKLGDK